MSKLKGWVASDGLGEMMECRGSERASQCSTPIVQAKKATFMEPNERLYGQESGYQRCIRG